MGMTPFNKKQPKKAIIPASRLYPTILSCTGDPGLERNLVGNEERKV